MTFYAKPRPDRRSVRRWNVMWPATLTIEGRDHPCTILDLSEFGARIEARGVQFGPSLAELHAERFGCLAARIQWARGAEAGLRFEAAPEEAMRVLRSLVPGLGRRAKVPEAPEPVAARRSFARLVRDAMAI
jgi:hypothetical protein